MAHILLIEPDKLLADTYRQAWLYAGHTVAIASGAQEAIDAADKTPPDIVILELLLSGHAGIEFLHEFRSYAEWQTIPVIINTHILPTVMETFREGLSRDMGVVVCLYKPAATLQQLLRAVNETMAAR